MGGRLVAALECAGVPVRCLARRPEALRDRVAASTEIVKGDCLDPATLPAALAGVETAYYLVHSMGSGKDFAAQDEAAARQLRRGGAGRGRAPHRLRGRPGRGGAQLSEHLRSRQQTGDVLRSAGVPVVELRASIVIGSGSLSYEMVRALVERLPVMICPRWVQVRTQPIAIDDLVAYVLAARDLPEGAEGVYEIGGPDAVSYREIMLEYARQRGLRRTLIPVPFLTPRLSSLWLGLVTPLYARVGRTLIESLRTPTVVTSDRARTAFPDVRPRPLREAIARALSREDAEVAATRWSDAVSSAALPRPWGGARYGTRLVDTRARVVAAPPHRAFAPVRRLGGAAGWYWGNALWRLRGALDVAAGGAGMRRGPPPSAPHPDRGRARLLAGRGLRGGPAPAPRGRDAPARPRLAAVRGVARRRGSLRDPADRDLRSRRPRRSRLLVRALPRPLADLRRHAARPRRPRGGGAGRGGRGGLMIGALRR